MKKFLCIVLLTILGSILPFVGSASAVAAVPTCIKLTLGITNGASTEGSLEIQLLDGGSGNSVFYDHTFIVPANSSAHFQVFIDATIVGPIGFNAPVVSLGIVAVLSFPTVPWSNCLSNPGHIDDGRINAYDLAAPLAAYCTADHGMEVWDIDDTWARHAGLHRHPGSDHERSQRCRCRWS